ncbi:dUTP diphosphatase [bacterium]|nr:dUTP diphosphatase [bacterium]
MGSDLPAEVGISYLPHHGELPAPGRATEGSAGYDIYAACDEGVLINPGDVKMVPSGFKLSVPRGYEAQVRPRSGLALNSRIGILNSPGTIDSDYRGEVGVILYNFGSEEFLVRRGNRIAQFVICKLPDVCLVELDRLDVTKRGDGGFGHTG